MYKARSEQRTSFILPYHLQSAGPAESRFPMICKELFRKSIEKNASWRRESFHPQRRRVRREEKNSGAELAPAEEFFIPLKFSGREPLGEQENLHPEKSDPSLFSEASALPMR